MKGKVSSVAVAFACLCAATDAMAADWRIYSGTDTMMLVLDASSLKQGNRVASVWTGVLNKEKDRFGLDYILVRREVDCEAETSNRTSFTGYVLGGMNIASSEERTPLVPARPDSTDQHLIKAVCNDDYYEEGVSDIETLLLAWRGAP